MDSSSIVLVTNPVYELLFIHHQRSLAHHIDSCTTLTVAGHPRTTVPIIHCTDDAHTTDCTDHTQLIPICTLFISLGLSLCDRRVLYAHIATLADSYLTEPFVVVIVLSCLVCFLVFWFLPVFPGLTLCLAVVVPKSAPLPDYASPPWNRYLIA